MFLITHRLQGLQDGGPGGCLPAQANQGALRCEGCPLESILLHLGPQIPSMEPEHLLGLPALLPALSGALAASIQAGRGGASGAARMGCGKGNPGRSAGRKERQTQPSSCSLNAA